MRRKLFLVILGVALLLTPSLPAGAISAPPKDKGLLITPLRQFISVNAGSIQKSSFTVANLNSLPMTVNLTVKQFSVTNYTYDYRFNEPHPSWLHLNLNQVSLNPHESRDITYTIAVPAGSTPGGQYYTLFASATVQTGGLTSTVQAADLLYLTVNGALIKTSHLQSSSIQRLVFGKQVGYTLNPINTGNIYFFVYTSAELHGLFTHSSTTSAARLLMPGKVRTLSDSISTPPLPGIYRATYGYKTDSGWIVVQSKYIVFIPPWFIALLLVILLVGGRFWPQIHTTINKIKHRTTRS